MSVDYIGRFESIEDDFAEICSKLGIHGARLPHLNGPWSPKREDHYDDETIEIVRKAHKADIEEFGYEY